MYIVIHRRCNLNWVEMTIYSMGYVLKTMRCLVRYCFLGMVVFTLLFSVIFVLEGLFSSSPFCFNMRGYWSTYLAELDHVLCMSIGEISLCFFMSTPLFYSNAIGNPITADVLLQRYNKRTQSLRGQRGKLVLGLLCYCHIGALPTDKDRFYELFDVFRALFPAMAEGLTAGGLYSLYFSFPKPNVLSVLKGALSEVNLLCLIYMADIFITELGSRRYRHVCTRSVVIGKLTTQLLKRQARARNAADTSVDVVTLVNKG